jgi:hypothetical protein
VCTVAEKEEPGLRCRLVIRRLKGLAVDNKPMLLPEIAETPIAGAPSRPGFAKHPGGHPSGRREVPADVPAMPVPARHFEELVDAGGRAADRATAWQDSIVCEYPT